MRQVRAESFVALPCTAGFSTSPVIGIRPAMDGVVPHERAQTSGRGGRDGARRAPIGKRVDRAARRVLRLVLRLVLPTRPNGSLPPCGEVRNILLVRPNFRIGNTVLATALIPTLQARFPRAAIDVLVGDTAAALLEGQAVRRVYVVSRRFVWHPWSFVALFRRLRAVRYDLALDPAMCGLSGALYSWLSGARHRIGAEGPYRSLLTIRLTMPKRLNVYDRAPAVCHALGWDALPYPSHRVSTGEDVAAGIALRKIGLRRHDAGAAFLGVFVGGHGTKRWPRHNWVEVVRLLSDERAPAVVFVGPEEVDMLASLGDASGPTVCVVPPRPLRTFASMLARASLLLTTDSGPMHLAAALHVPVVAIVQMRRSFVFVPPGSRNRALFRPTAQEVTAAMKAHAAWLEAPTHVA
jgi:heptosyltransferase-3